MRSLAPLIGLSVLLCGAGCKRAAAPVPDAGAAPAQCQTIPSTQLCWRPPSTWEVAPVAPSGPEEPVSASVAPAGADAGDQVAQLLAASELVMNGRRSAPDREFTFAPRIEVYQDRRLPQGTTITDYLVANRAAQKRSLGDVAVRHLEVEPIRRQARRGFHLRDAFDVPLPQGGKAPVSQQALILLDERRGYVVVVTMLEDDRAALSDEVHALLSSVTFR